MAENAIRRRDQAPLAPNGIDSAPRPGHLFPRNNPNTIMPPMPAFMHMIPISLPQWP